MTEIQIPGVDFRFPITNTWCEEINGKIITKITTYARIKGTDGKYYLKRIIREGDREIDLMWLIMFDVYLELMCSKVDTNLILENGAPVYVLDENQTDEKERLIKKYNLKEH